MMDAPRIYSELVDVRKCVTMLHSAKLRQEEFMPKLDRSKLVYTYAAPVPFAMSYVTHFITCREWTFADMTELNLGDMTTVVHKNT